jgi:hypothetical protein
MPRNQGFIPFIVVNKGFAAIQKHFVLPHKAGQWQAPLKVSLPFFVIEPAKGAFTWFAGSFSDLASS